MTAMWLSDTFMFRARHLCLLIGACAAPAYAQRVDENAVAKSEDAFGKAVGGERTGIYSSEDVRGFNPVDAGNARIEGLYFDQLDRLTQRLQDGSTIRVGISAQHYPFPAPTGLVDYKLSKPGGTFEGSIDLELAEFGSRRSTIEMKVPLDGERLGLLLGAGTRRQHEAWGGTTRQINYAGLIAWRPASGAELSVFLGQINASDEEARPTIFPAGNFLPPHIKRRAFLGQYWADRKSSNRIIGGVATVPLGGITLEAGLFKVRRTTDTVFADLLTGVTKEGVVADRTIIADGNNLDQSLSGEARLVRKWKAGGLRHSLTFSLRGRDKDRLFGGTQRIPLFVSSAIKPDFRPRPTIMLGAENEDQVRQFGYGVAYGGEWAGRGSLDISLMRSNYRKAVNFADPLRADTVTRDRPILWNVAGSIIATKRLAFYAGYVKGLEEALIAPDIAKNRAETPPAIRTRQMDAGLRYAITPKLSFVGGVFSVRKPYYNLDPGQVYRQLGSLENRGVELSLAGELRPGLSLVAGTVFIDSAVSGEAVTSGLIGKRPVGSSKQRSNENVDWRTKGGKGVWSFDLAYDGRGGRVANSANTLSAKARNSFNLGTRYRFKLGDSKALFRLQVQNIFNEYGWAVTSSGGLLYSSPRTVTVQLIADF